MAYDQNTNFDNERKYLENLIAGGGGNGAWAQNQLAELNKAEKQYGAPTSTENNYYPERGGTGSIPKGSASSVNVGAGKITAPNGDELALHDWSKDTTDYSAQMQNAKTIQEFLKAAQDREHKANAQGIDISGASGAMSNEQIYNEWAKKNNYNPSYGGYLYGGYGKDWQGNETWIDNAGIGQGYYGMDASGNWGYYADPGLTQKLDNGNWARSSDGGPVILDERGLPNMTKAGRDMSRAGQTVIVTGNGRDHFKVTYGENGYITGWSRLDTNHVDGLKMASAANNGAGVTSQELLKQQTGHTYVGPGATITQDQVSVGTPAQYQQVIAARGETGYDTQNPSGYHTGGFVSGGTTALQEAIDRGYTHGSFNAQETTVPEVSAREAADYAEFIKQIYAKQLEQELAELSAQYESGRNQTAAQSEIARRNFSEQANAHGLNSGTSGQAELARSANLQSDLASLQGQYISAMQRAQSENDIALAQALYSEYVRQEEAAAAADKFAQEMAYKYKALDYEKAYNDAYLALQQAKNAAKAQSAATPAKPTLTAAQTLKALKSGVVNDATKAAYEYYYGQPYDDGTQPGTVVPPVYTPKVGYNNGGLTREQVKQLQGLLGVSQDGYWGPETQAAANAMWGTTDADKAFGRSGIRSGNALSSGGAMTLAAQAGSTATAQVAKLIELYNAGQITEQQLKDLQYSILNPNK